MDMHGGVGLSAGPVDPADPGGRGRPAGGHRVDRPRAAAVTAGGPGLPLEGDRVVLRAVVDGVQHCNLRCLYCHPGEVWREQHLPAERMEAVFAAAEHAGLLEVVISGGEITLHPGFGQMLDAVSRLRRTASTLITNATRVDPGVADLIGASDLTRVCVSVDGADKASHGSARGKNLPRVLAGLRLIRATGKPVTVITVVHRGNYEQVLDLSGWLAAEGLADQHHLCAPSYSGTAREHYDDLKLVWDDYFSVQDRVDAAHLDLAAAGLFVTFNSFWPATGHRSPVLDGGRSITLQQLSEQVKDTLLHVRPDGQVKLTAASWGRESIGDAVIGNVNTTDPAVLLATAARVYRDGSVGQLPREVEARHKFQISRAPDRDRRAGAGSGRGVTDVLIDTPGQTRELVDLAPIVPLARLSLLDNPLADAELAALAGAVAGDRLNYRLVQHASGPVLLFDRRRSRVTLLHAAELPRLFRHIATASA